LVRARIASAGMRESRRNKYGDEMLVDCTVAFMQALPEQSDS
jgi:hypothetical protein